MIKCLFFLACGTIFTSCFFTGIYLFYKSLYNKSKIGPAGFEYTPDIKIKDDMPIKIFGVCFILMIVLTVSISDTLDNGFETIGSFWEAKNYSVVYEAVVSSDLTNNKNISAGVSVFCCYLEKSKQRVYSIESIRPWIGDESNTYYGSDREMNEIYPFYPGTFTDEQSRKWKVQLVKKN